MSVFEDLNPFPLLECFEVKQFSSVFDIESNEKGTCVYVACGREGQRCVWKITEGTGDQHNIIKWLTIDFVAYHCALSVSSLGNVLIVCQFLPHMSIYGSDAERRKIDLPRDINSPVHAVETSIGYFIILHELMIKEEKGAIVNSKRVRETEYVVSELTRDGQTVTRRFIPSNQIQKLIYPAYLAIGSDDQVFVADSGKDRIVLLDSDLKWNRIICPTKQEEGIKTHFRRICYDEEKNQLICTAYYHSGLSVYTLTRK